MILRKKAKSGFTLIEVVISMVLVVAILIPIMDILIASSKKQQLASRKQQGTEVGQSKIEEFSAYKTLNVTGYNATTGIGTITDLDGNTYNMTQNPVTNTWESTETEVDGYTIKLSLDKNAQDITYDTNSAEVQALDDTNYSNVLTFTGTRLKYYDSSSPRQPIASPYIDANSSTMYLYVYGDEVSHNITGIGFKRLPSDTETSIPVSGVSGNKIKIVQDSDFFSSSDVTLNIATQIPIDVDVVNKPNVNATFQYKILAMNQADVTRGLDKQIVIKQNLTGQTVDVPATVYVLSVEVKDRSNNVVFKGSITKNFEIETNP